MPDSSNVRGAVFETVIERSRRIRHVLDAWCLLLLCPAVGAIPWLGFPLGEFFGLVGVSAGIRLAHERRIVQGLAFVGVFSIWLIIFPFIRISRSGIYAPRSAGANQTPAYYQGTPAASVLTPLIESRNVIPSVESSPLPTGALPVSAPAPESVIQNLASFLHSGNSPSNPPLHQERTILTTPQRAEAIILNWWEARQSGNLNMALSLFADRSVVGGQTFSREELRYSLAADWRQNAAISESIVGPLHVSTEAGHLKVEHRVSFKIPSKGGGFPTRGQCLHTFYLQDAGDALQILEHRDAVIPSITQSPTSVAGIKTTTLRSIVCGCLEADAAGDLDASLASYAKKVNYYGKLGTHDILRADKAHYFTRWPKRWEQFENSLAVDERTPGQACCSLRSVFHVENPERGDWREGLAEHHFVIMSIEGRALIVAQSSTVIESRAGTLPP